MYLRTRTWAIISVVCFLAAIYFWRLGEERAVHEQEARRAARTNAAGPLLSTQTNVAAQAQARPRQVGFIETNGPVPYRVSNTRLPIDDLIRSDAALLLRNALIDATSDVELPIPPHLRLQGETKSYVVQSRGTITENFRAGLRNAGAEIVSYVPNNAYLVRVSPESAQSLRGLPQVQAVIAWEPLYKITDSKLLALAVEEKPLPNGNPLVVMAFPGEEEATAQALRDLGGTVMRSQSSPFGAQLLVHTPPDQLIAVAQLDTVQAIEPSYRRVLANDLARTRVGVSTNTVTLDNHLGRRGNGITVGVNDTGVDINHPDLGGVTRVLLDDPSTGVDLNGHGTHVIGTIASSGNSDFGVNAPGSINNADFRGMAPESKVFVQPIDIVTGPLKPDTELQRVAASNGVFVSNNSWGYLGAFDYTFAAASWDAAVRDAIPGQQGSQAQTYVFAAGNSGLGNTDGSGGFANSITAPGTAKNVITVGAIEQFRNLTNEIVINGVTNVPFATLTDTENQVASFSSRGNVSPGIEGSFGRFKPDVVAPGVFLVSTRATDWSDNLNLSFFPGFLTDEVVPVGQTNFYFFITGPNSVEARIRILPNGRSPLPFPTNSIYISRGAPPPPSISAVNSNMLNIPVTEDTYYIGVGNNYNQDVHFDIQVVIIDENPPSPGDLQLVQLNQSLGTLYRFESGTSMATPVVSGMLALMQEHLAARGMTNPSPALMKALLINGARSVGQNDLQVTKVLNRQGWGLANITNSLPLHSPANLAEWPVRFFDQETNGLITGETATRTITVNSNSEALRITLVWTDPPGNPSVGSKLVNDLDLIVTNKTTGEIFIGNRIAGDFNAPIDGSNIVASVDRINNVENVYIRQPLSNQTYSVTVRARRVNVNAITAHDAMEVAQDYALVISSGNPGERANFTVVDGGRVSDPSYEVQRLTNGVPILKSTVGANPSLWSAPNSNGFTNQWRFFVFENTNLNTNVAFFAFLTPNLSRVRQSEEADIDLYVSLNPALTNLDATVIANASTSRKRGGTEAVVFTNASADQFFYIGVKSEDQQAALFGLAGFATDTPFSQTDSNGVVTVLGLGVPVAIPDGSSEEATPVFVFGYCLEEIQIRNVVVTNVLTHQTGGDLVGVLDHNTRRSVLNNHRSFQGTNLVFIYDDSDSGQIVNSTPTDAPGSLRNFWGEEGQGTWQLTMVDNALSGVGRIEDFSLRLEPAINTNDSEFTTVTILPNRWFFTVVDVPPDATRLTIEVVPDPGDVEVYVGRNFVPDDVTYDYFARFDTSGGVLEITPADSPPLSQGLYFIGLRNPNSFAITVRIKIRIERNLGPPVTNIYSRLGMTNLIDDAVTTSWLSITDSREVADIRVGVRIQHNRASDLVLSLVSPAGTRVLLAENRGGESTLGYGAGRTSPYLHTIFTDNTNLTITPIKFGTSPFTNSPGPTNLQTSIVAGPAIFFSGFEDTSWPCNSLLNAGDTVNDPTNGWFVGGGSVDLLCNGPNGQADSGSRWLELNGISAGWISRIGNVPTVANEEYLLTFAYSKNPGITNAEADILINSATNAVISYSFPNTTTNLDWRAGSTRFRATGPTTRLVFQSRTPGGFGLYLDSIQIVPITVQTNGRNYFLPEEPLREMRGENAYGNWRLEIWDNRVGEPLNAQLLDWQLDFDFANTNAPTTVLTHGQCYTNTIEGSAVQYFRVDVPVNATRATNTFFSANRLSMSADATTLPVGSFPPDDYPPVIGLNGLLEIDLADNPPLRPGLFYYVALRNVNPQETNAFTFCVNFDASPTNNLSTVVPLTNNTCLTRSIEGTNLISYYSFDASTNAVGLFFDLIGVNGNVDLFVKRGLPLPFPGNSSASRNPGTASEHIAIGTGQIPGRWYVGVLNNDLTNVNYTLCVSEVTNYFRLTNDVCSSNMLTAFNQTHHYRFTIGPTTESAQFELSGTGDVDLYVRKTPPVSRFVYDYASEVFGQSNEMVVVQSDSFPVPLTPGDWHVAVVSKESALVNYCLKVTEFDPDSIRLYITNGWSNLPRYMDLTIVGPDYLQYVIEYSDTLTDDPASWQVFTDQATGFPLIFGPFSTTYTYRDTPLTIGNPPGLVPMRFYRVRVL